jgi:uncharacterized protein (TIGR02186 family)
MKLILFFITFSLNIFALSANISKNKIIINTVFEGDIIEIFGKKEAKGEIIIIFKSQKVDYKIYAKERIFGIWQNSSPNFFRNTYNIYQIKTERLQMLTDIDILKDLEIGVLNVSFQNFVGNNTSIKNYEYKEEFLRQKLADGSFKETKGGVQFFPKTDVFTSSIKIPIDIKTGQYILEVLLINNGEVQAINMFNISIERSGLLLQIKQLSEQNKTLYSIIAMFISIFIAFSAFYLAKMLYYNRRLE